MLMRLQKLLAEAGIASRRAGEEVIRAGRVAVNGRVVREMGTKVDPLHDAVTVDGTPVKAKLLSSHGPEAALLHTSRASAPSEKRPGILPPSVSPSGTSRTARPAGSSRQQFPAQSALRMIGYDGAEEGADDGQRPTGHQGHDR